MKILKLQKAFCNIPFEADLKGLTLTSFRMEKTTMDKYYWLVLVVAIMLPGATLTPHLYLDGQRILDQLTGCIASTVTHSWPVLKHTVPLIS